MNDIDGCMVWVRFDFWWRWNYDVCCEVSLMNDEVEWWEDVWVVVWEDEMYLNRVE